MSRKIIALEQLARFKEDLYNNLPSSIPTAFVYTGEGFDDPDGDQQTNFHYDIVSDEFETILTKFPISVYFDDWNHQAQLMLSVNLPVLRMAVYTFIEDGTQYSIQFMDSNGDKSIVGWGRPLITDASYIHTASLGDVLSSYVYSGYKKGDILIVGSGVDPKRAFIVRDLRSNKIIAESFEYVGDVLYQFKLNWELDDQQGLSIITEPIPFPKSIKKSDVVVELDDGSGMVYFNINDEANSIQPLRFEFTIKDMQAVDHSFIITYNFTTNSYSLVNSDNTLSIDEAQQDVGVGFYFAISIDDNVYDLGTATVTVDNIVYVHQSGLE